MWTSLTNQKLAHTIIPLLSSDYTGNGQNKDSHCTSVLESHIHLSNKVHEFLVNIILFHFHNTLSWNEHFMVMNANCGEKTLSKTCSLQSITSWRSSIKLIMTDTVWEFFCKINKSSVELKAPLFRILRVSISRNGV